MEKREDDADNPRKRKKDSATDTDDLNNTDIEVSILESINRKLAIPEEVHRERQQVRTSLEYSQAEIQTLIQTPENTILQTNVKTLTKSNGQYNKRKLVNERNST